VSSVECVSRLSILLSMSGTSLAVIVWLLDLQLSMQSVHITTKVVSSNPDDGEMYTMQHYVMQFVSDFSPDTPVYPPINLTATI
jgi:hypothetical protein